METLVFLEPFRDFSRVGHDADIEKGRECIAEGKVGCLIVAGGQGTRLRFDGPKGIYPLSVIQKKSLFQLLAEKGIAAGKQASQELPLAIMTSTQNHEDTLNFFEDHHYFGLNPENVSFFTQGELPLLSHEGNLFLDAPDHIATGPDGNGSSLSRFVASGIWERWYEQGVRYLNYILVDNALAAPFDAELIGYQVNQSADVVVKCVLRKDPKEKVGVLVRHEGKVKVVEYSELSDEWEGLEDVCANLSLFSFSMDFIHQTTKVTLPLHLAHKAVRYLTSEGESVQAEEPNAWKFESFIFDVLPVALKVKASLYPRGRCFAPLKNAEGDASPITVQKALQDRDRQVFAEITGVEPPERPFELSQDFHYPTFELLKTWKGKPLPSFEYITPNSIIPK